jgi:hypothetical protein
MLFFILFYSINLISYFSIFNILIYIYFLVFQVLFLGVRKEYINNKLSKKKNQQWFNAKDECLPILWKYIFTKLLKGQNDLIFYKIKLKWKQDNCIKRKIKKK